MNKIKFRNLLSSIFITAILFLTTDASAITYNEDKLVLGNEFVLEAGESLNGNLVVFGGEVTLKKNSTVNGDIVLFGGQLEIDNTVNGDVTLFGGDIDLKSHAVVNGDFTSFGADVDRDKNAYISGDSIRQDSKKAPKVEDIVKVPAQPEIVTTTTERRGLLDSLFAFMTKVLLFMARVLAFTGIAVLANLLFEKHLAATSQTIVKRPLESIGIGLLTIVALPFVMLFFTITVVLIPLVFILAILFVTVCLYGWIAVGYEFGRIVTRALKVQWSSNWTTAAGTFSMSLILFLLSKLIPCIGWIPSAVVLAAGIGAIIIHHGKLFQDNNKKQDHLFLQNNTPNEQSVLTEVFVPKTSTPPAAPETGKNPAVTDVIELGPVTTPKPASEQPDTAPHQEETAPESSQPKTDSKAKPQGKSFGASFLDALHEEITDTPVTAPEPSEEEALDTGTHLESEPENPDMPAGNEAENEDAPHESRGASFLNSLYEDIQKDETSAADDEQHDQPTSAGEDSDTEPHHE